MSEEIKSSARRRSLIKPLVDAMPLALGPKTERNLRADGFKGSTHRMSLNECPYPPSPAVADAVAAAAAGVNRYPDAAYTDLVDLMSVDFKVPREHIFFSSGSDVLLQALGEMVVDEDTSVIVPDPSFARYGMAAKVRGGEIIAVPVAQDGRNDVEAMIAAVKGNTRLMYVATPNNPTGQMLNAAEVERICRDTPDHVLLALDEAYFEFARYAGGPDCLEIVRETRTHAPWALLRTFSKAYGLAGARVGYVVSGSDEVSNGFNKIRTSFNLNAFSQAAALAAYKDQDYCNELISKMSAERDRLMEAVQKMGLETMPSVGNFFIINMPGPGPLMVEALWQRGIMIGAIRTPTPGFENCIRITVGLPEDGDAFLAALKDELDSGRVYPAE
jgi:histidinol-phosphate aminotransferase